MKKYLSLFLAALMLVSCTAFAENLLEADPEELLTFDRKVPVTDWEGEWVLAAAYIGEDYADENDIETTGLLAVPEKAVTMSVKAVLDGSATGSDAGVMVDQAAYIHTHVYDIEATVAFDASITDETATLKLPWDGWDWTKDEEWTGWTEGSSYTSKGVGKLSKVGADDKSLYFCKITGVESEEIADENMKYVGMNTAGQLIVCYSDDNMVKKDGDVGFAFIFVKAE
ncbi:MAG: hypothetical protein K6A68_05520 [Clostridiales bacterium]|nr:hypothetical protein [Clostridiales bacterium]